MQEVFEKYLKGLKIAVVDDSLAFGAGIRSLVEPYLAAVEFYQSSKAALEAFLVEPPDFVVTDLEMPDLDGACLVAELRKSPRFDAVPILVLTGKADLETMVRITKLGADGFLDKKEINDRFLIQLLALARQRELFKKASSEKQLIAVQALIGTYRHEFGNVIAVVEGKLRKLKRTRPELENDETYQAIVEWSGKLIQILNNLNDLMSYEENKYVGNVNILKLK